MVSKEVRIVNASGLHLRPAGLLTQTAMRYKSKIIIQHGTKEVIAKSVLNVMAACITAGAVVKVVCDGVDEEEALAAVTAAIESGLGEEPNPEYMNS